jgi:16S rRNA (uracil1498-N3)-methyltransferase
VPLFITTSDEIKASEVRLSAEEAHHALQVLRLHDSAQIQLTDGAGTLATARLRKHGKKQALAVIEHRNVVPARNPRIHVYLGMLKTRQRLEIALEKLTEIGTDEINLLDTEHTERQKFRMDRAEGIVMSAVKQSKSAWIPALHHYAFEQALEAVAAQEGAHHILLAAHEKKQFALSDGSEHQGRSFSEIRSLLRNTTKPSEPKKAADSCLTLHIFIGPEGGFSADELTRMMQIPRAQPLWLGDIRLRAETAAIQIAGLFRFGL